MLAMRNSPRLTICIVVALAIVAIVTSGCGGSTKASTTYLTTSTASQPSSQSGTQSGTVSPSAGSTGATHSATEPKVAEATPKGQERTGEGAGSGGSSAAGKSGTQTVEHPPTSRKHEFALDLQRKFMTACTAGQGSKGRCECILFKFENANVERGQAIAEMLVVEVGLQGESLESLTQKGNSKRIALTANDKRYLVECRRA